MSNPPDSHPLHHRLVGACFAGLIRSTRFCPAFLAYALADLLVPVLVAWTWISRKSADRKKRGFYRNVQIAFAGQLRGPARRRLLWSWARHMCWFAVDVCKMPQFGPEQIRDRIDTSELEALQQGRSPEEGLLLVSGHIGIYEYCAQLCALAGMDLLSIFRESPIPPVTDALNQVRGACGQQLVERQGAVRAAMRGLARGQAVGVVADVSAKESRVFAPFLGTAAATNAAVGLLALRSRVPVAVIGVHRCGRQRFRFKVWDQFRLPPGLEREEAVQTTATRINAAMSQALHQYPEQWFWDCRRFRVRPAGELRGSDDLPPVISPTLVMRPEMIRG